MQTNWVVDRFPSILVYDGPDSLGFFSIDTKLVRWIVSHQIPRNRFCLFFFEFWLKKSLGVVLRLLKYPGLPRIPNRVDFLK